MLATERSSFGREVKAFLQEGWNPSVAAQSRHLRRESGQISIKPTRIDLGIHPFYTARLSIAAAVK